MFSKLLERIGKHVESEMKFQASLRGLKINNEHQSSFDDDGVSEEEKEAVHNHAMDEYNKSVQGS